MERMVEVVLDSNWQSLQNFVSHSPWDYRALLVQRFTKTLTINKIFGIITNALTIQLRRLLCQESVNYQI